jgi:Ferritin-like domain
VTAPDLPARSSRGDVLRRGSAAAAVAVAAGLGWDRVAHATAASVTPSPAQDREILNFALLLEYLQHDFYTDALKRGGLKGEVHHFAEVVGEHERAHVVHLRDALGAHARSKPRFAFGQKTRHERSFLKAAVVLENVGVLAYNGQAANLTKPVLASAAEIVSVEGRHAAWISDLAGRTPAPRAADVGISAADALRKLRMAGLLKAK